MMRNTLPPLLQQFVSPGFQLRGDRFDACGLFNRPGFNAAWLLFAKLRAGRFDQRVDGVAIDVFAELFEHLDGGADLGCGWSVHNQMFRCGCRDLACARVLAGVLVGVWEAIAPVSIQLPRPDAPTVH